MKRFILIKANEEFYSGIIDILNIHLGKYEYNVAGILIIYFESDSIEEIKLTIHSLEADLGVLITYYISNYEEYSRELKLVMNLFLKANYGGYDFKKLLFEAKGIDNAKDLLEFILDRTGITKEIIASIAENDLNITRSAKELFMHRNTLLYKSERLIALKEFDLKSFKDVYILMKLIYS